MTISVTNCSRLSHARRPARFPSAIFPTPLNTSKFVFNRGPRTSDSGRASRRRSDCRDLRSRGVGGPGDAEDPQDAPVRPLVRVALARPRLLPHPDRVVPGRRSRPPTPPVPPDIDLPSRSSTREDVDRAAHPARPRNRVRRLPSALDGPVPLPRGGPRGPVHLGLLHPGTHAGLAVVLRLLRLAAPGDPAGAPGRPRRLRAGREG